MSPHPEAHRLRGELRRFAHPAVPLAVALVAAGICAAQHQAAGHDPRPPSPIDLTGSIRIAIQHHSTAFGFFLVAVGAGTSTGHDARDGALGQALVAGGPAPRVWARRMAALLVLAATSTAVSAVAVHATRGATACTPACPVASRSSGASVILPATWVARTVQSSPYGYGVDYLGGISPAHHRDAATAVAAAVLLVAAAGCGAVAIRALEVGGARAGGAD